MLKKILNNEKGTFIIEAVMSFLLFVIILVGIIEVFSLVESKLYVEKISREVCHEAIVTSVAEANLVRDVFKLQYFTNEDERPFVNIHPLTTKDNYIYCYVEYYHPPFRRIFPDKEGRLQIDATTIFPWDKNRK